MLKAFIASALLGAVALGGQAQTPAAHSAVHDEFTEVLVFSQTAASAHDAESLTLRTEFNRSSLTLPPQLLLFHIKGAGKRDANPAGGAPEGSIKAYYSPWGPYVVAAKVPGTAPPPPVSGKPILHYRLVVLSNPVAGREQEYNDWYDNQHVGDVLRNPGFVSAPRLKLLRTTPANLSLPRYAVIFQFDSADLEATIVEVRRRLAAGITRFSTSFDTPTSISRYYEISAGFEANPPAT
jgi:hypothetical protein